MKLGTLINHTPGKLVLWRGRGTYAYEVFFPNGFSIEGKEAESKEEAKELFIQAWNLNIIKKNGRFAQQLYPYWG